MCIIKLILCIIKLDKMCIVQYYGLKLINNRLILNYFKKNLNGEIMNLYFELLKHPVFTIKDVNQYYNKIESARSAVKRLMGKGLAVKIRNNLYTCISGETDAPLANRYQIASAITGSSFISHHSAMEYYGVSDQVFYEVYVSSEEKFQDFEFDGYVYRCVCSKCNSGVESIKYSGGVRITDRERTVIDSIKDMDKIAGLEEVVDNIQKISRLDEKRLLAYLACYRNQFLYQKTGFLLGAFQKRSAMSDDFFETCRKKMGSSKRYLTKDCAGGKYDSEWQLIIPAQFDSLKNGG